MRRIGGLGLAVTFIMMLARAPDLGAQETGSVTGRVTNSATGQPIEAAQISLVGTRMGGLSQSNGRYLILNVPTGDYTVRAEIIGFATQQREVTVTAGSAANADFTLNSEAISLNEVVVTGTAGAARRKEVGNSISSLDVSQLDEVKPPTNTSDLLQGQVAGLTQFHTGGQPGAGTAIRIRGNNSITQGNAPLIYIDGVRMVSAVPTDEGSEQVATALDLLNPNDIQRIEVIKGAAATTLYGTQASSGVIQIFTKKGVRGTPVWSFQTTEGINHLTGNNLGPVVGADPTWVNIKPWVNDGRVSKVNGSVEGSTSAVNYYLSGAYSYNGGVFSDQPNGNDSKIANFRTNLGFQPLNGLNVAVSAGYAHRVTDWVQSGDNRYGVILNLLRSPKNYVSGNDAEVFNQRTQSIDDHFVGGITGTYNPVASFTNRFTVGLDWRDGTNGWVIPKDHPIKPDGWRTENRWRHTTATMDYVGTWRYEPYESLSSQFSFGGQLFSDYDHRVNGDTQNLASPGLDVDLNSGALPNNGESLLKQVNAGFFLQELVAWHDRLFVTGGARWDGNSAFGKNYGLQLYPKLSVSYVLSDLAAWPDWWEAMKLRAAVGESGKAPGAFDAVRTYSPSLGNGGQPGMTPNNLGDPNLGPERTREYEAGFEGSLLDDRVSYDFSYYNATTMDALVPVQSPPSEGFANPQLRNVGKLQNKGIELTLGLTPYRSENLTATVTTGVSTDKSEAKDLQGQELAIGYSSWRQWAREGSPVPSYYAPKVTNPDAIADPIYQSDGYFGPVYPTHDYTVSLNVNFLRRFTFYGLMEATGGNYYFDAVGRQQAARGLWPVCNVSDPSAQTALWRAQCEDLEWGAFITPADIVKLRTLSLTYQLPAGLIPGTSQGSFTLAAENVYKWTDYQGLDPEISRGDISAQDYALARREYYGVPPATALTASLRIVF